MKIIIDTSAYVAFKLNNSKAVTAIDQAEHIMFSTIVLGELMFGFRNGSKFDENMDNLNLFLQHDIVSIIQVTKITSDRYSRITHQLKVKGTPIPTNDIWIAAQTMESGAELITSDKHFEKIPGLIYSFV